MKRRTFREWLIDLIAPGLRRKAALERARASDLEMEAMGLRISLRCAALNIPLPAVTTIKELKWVLPIGILVLEEQPGVLMLALDARVKAHLRGESWSDDITHPRDGEQS